MIFISFVNLQVLKSFLIFMLKWKYESEFHSISYLLIIFNGIFFHFLKDYNINNMTCHNVTFYDPKWKFNLDYCYFSFENEKKINQHFKFEVLYKIWFIYGTHKIHFYLFILDIEFFMYYLWVKFLSVSNKLFCVCVEYFSKQSNMKLPKKTEVTLNSVPLWCKNAIE